MSEDKNRYCFLAEWFDVHAQLNRTYELFFYPSDHSIEMVQIINIVRSETKTYISEKVKI
jgi:hypothetical protein